MIAERMEDSGGTTTAFSLINQICYVPFVIKEGMNENHVSK